MAGPPEIRRSVEIRVSIRPGEAADLRKIADGWGVPPATAAWAILHEALRRARRRAPELGPAGLAIAAGVALLGREAAGSGAGEDAPGWAT